MKRIINTLLIILANTIFLNAFEPNTMTAKDINKIMEETAIAIPEPAKTPDIGPSNKGNTEPQIAELSAILKGKEVIQMPPVGIQHFANELNVNVELASCTGEAGFRQLTETKIKEVLDFWKEIGYRNATNMFGLQQDGVQVLYLAEVNGENNNITDYLINSIVRKQDRARVKALLNSPDLAADFVRIQTYDVSSEIIGREIILIKPWNARKALVIELDYTHS